MIQATTQGRDLSGLGAHRPMLLLAPLVLLAAACGGQTEDAEDPPKAPTTASQDGATPGLDDRISDWAEAFDRAHGAQDEFVANGVDAAILVLEGLAARAETMRLQKFPDGAGVTLPLTDLAAVQAACTEYGMRGMAAFDDGRAQELRRLRVEMLDATSAFDAAEAALVEATGTAQAEPAPSEGSAAQLAKQANELASGLHSIRRARAAWTARITKLEELGAAASSSPEVTAWIEAQLADARGRLPGFDTREDAKRAEVQEARASFAQAAKAERIQGATGK